MSASSLHFESSKNSPSATNHSIYKSQAAIWLSRYLLAMAIATLFLMALGSATRVMNAGLSCPDWPLCYGEFVPVKQMNLLVFLEWFHRVVATTMGLFTLILVSSAWWWRASLPKWIPGATILALGIVICQGILGGLTVTELLRFDIVTAHLGTGLLFFSTLLTTAIALNVSIYPNLAPGSGSSRFVKAIAILAVLSVYGQSILGALVASQWAVHQCLAEATALCGVLHNHFWGVAPATGLSLVVVYFAWRDRNCNALAKWAGLEVGICLIAQISLGVATYKMQLQIPALTVMHQSVGACLLAGLIIFAVVNLVNVQSGTQPNLPSNQFNQKSLGNISV